MLTSHARDIRDSLIAHSTVAVIDLEATCYDNDEDESRYKNEVIEVGWVKLNLLTGEISDKQSFYVAPTTSIVTPFCTQLTSITPEMVESAPSFASTMRVLEKHHQAHGIKMWLSHGAYDIRKLKSQCEEEGVDYPFAGAGWLNIKLIARLVLQRKRRLGMVSLLDDLELPLIGSHHVGADDAFNSAQIVRELVRRWSQGELSAPQFDLIARVIHLSDPKAIRGAQGVLVDGLSVQDAANQSDCEPKHLTRVIARMRQVQQDILAAFCQ